MTFPLGLTVRDLPCLVVGDGRDAIGHAGRLGALGARVALMTSRAPALEPAGVDWLAPTESGLDAYRLVLVLSDPPLSVERVRKAVAADALVYVLGRPELSNIELPATIARGALSLALSGGPGPVLAALAERAWSVLPAGTDALLAWARRHEVDIAAAVPRHDARERLWNDLLDGPAAESVLSGHEADADRWLTERLRAGHGRVPAGEVYLIGGGPGDPDLLTLKALRLLRRADVVLYDRLVAPAIVELARDDAERVYVGKSRNVHPVPQDSINALLVHYARQGKRVARLKGGDPFIFGRGGEELETLMEEGITFQVVPGVTAASGCAAYAGIPLTHRDYAQSCIFVTGHRKHGRLDLDFAPLVQPQQTVVFYMGLQGLDELAAGLIAHGMRPDMPAALVQQGTTSNQRVIRETIETLPEAARASGVVAPTLVIVGDVVRLRDKLAWFEGRESGSGLWPPVERS